MSSHSSRNVRFEATPRESSRVDFNTIHHQKPLTREAQTPRNIPVSNKDVTQLVLSHDLDDDLAVGGRTKGIRSKDWA